MTRHLFHLAIEDQWRAAVAEGAYRVSTRGRTLDEEGFIHLCTAEQVAAVGQRFYADEVVPLVLLTVDVTRLVDPLVLEVPSGATEAFPHLYGPLPIDAVVHTSPHSVGTPTSRLHHTHIFASDIDATIDFWVTNLGARVASDEILLGSRNVMIELGDGRLNVYDQAPLSNPGPGRLPGPVHHLGIQVRDLDGLVDHMTANGVAFRKPITSGEGFRYVMVAAPDGLLLELFEAVGATMPPSAAGWFSWE